jgi:hypothetical protein
MSNPAARVEAEELDDSAEWDIGATTVVTGVTVVAFP